MKRQEALARNRRQRRWLQTKYPVELARKLLAWRADLTPQAERELAMFTQSLLRTQRCERHTEVPMLWEAEKALTTQRGHILMQSNKHVPVRCTSDFEWILFGRAWASEKRAPDAGLQLSKLLDSICPRASAMCQRRWNPRVVFEACDFVAPKAFVHTIILLSKWLGQDRFPEGVHYWPPTFPIEVTDGM